MANPISEDLSKGLEWFMDWEIDFIHWFQSLGGESSILFYLMSFFTMFGEELFLIGIMGTIYWGIDKKKGERIGLFVFTALMCMTLLKNGFRRLRPFHIDSNVLNLRDVSGFAFPSGHATGSMAAFGGLVAEFRERKLRWLVAVAIIIPILVALSRNHLGAHWPTDVIAGLLLGLFVIIILPVLLSKVRNKYIIYIGLLLFFAIGLLYCTTEDYFSNFGMMIGFVAGIYFEERFVNFRNTTVWWKISLRVLVGGALFFILNTLLKLPFNIEEMTIWEERLFRITRYAIVVFLLVGPYPFLFSCKKSKQ